jgi:hypothetical protein
MSDILGILIVVSVAGFLGYHLFRAWYGLDTVNPQELFDDSYRRSISDQYTQLRIKQRTNDALIKKLEGTKNNPVIIRRQLDDAYAERDKIKSELSVVISQM